MNFLFFSISCSAQYSAHSHAPPQRCGYTALEGGGGLFFSISCSAHSHAPPQRCGYTALEGGGGLFFFFPRVFGPRRRVRPPSWESFVYIIQWRYSCRPHSQVFLRLSSAILRTIRFHFGKTKEECKIQPDISTDSYTLQYCTVHNCLYIIIHNKIIHYNNIQYTFVTAKPVFNSCGGLVGIKIYCFTDPFQAFRISDVFF